MAREGWFDELTFHRMVPNFVLQGGSGGANEYAGGAEFSRDEVGGNHRRGTIGISTRGRDTGDGQIFINLVDNLNLDHEYTVIGEVTTGLELLDRILEGAIIARIEVQDD
jgi:cyclophilin family peptidyl-prolyl cis-trans isomerase